MARTDETKAQLVVRVFRQQQEIDSLRAQLRRARMPWWARLGEWMRARRSAA